MPELDLDLLGPPAVRVGGNEVTGALPAKPQAILYFLSRHRGPQSRSRVAGLLWPETSETAARANLRVALSRLRKVVGDCFAADRQWVGLADSWTVHSDVDPFLAATDAGDWSAVLTLYQGPFLATFDVGEAQPFEEWLIVERERLHQRAVRTLQFGLGAALADGDWQTGEALARRLLGLDPWREEAHRALMQCLMNTGRRAAALAQFEACRQILAEELDVEPAPATMALVEAIRAGTAATPFTGPARVTAERLPRPVSPLFGREATLRRLVEELKAGQTRLLTVTGLGGTGKTRLALAAAHELARLTPALFADGVAWVPLAAVNRQDTLLTAIAAALGFSFTGTDAPATQLRSFLRHKELLLVLDNFEQLVPEASLLAQLLQAAPGLALLVTSRERLRLVEETVLVLEGLDLGKGPEEVAASPAAQLFAERARRVDDRFDLAAEVEAVAAICRLVEGLPLGLELAASWTHAFACADIAAAMARELDALADTARDLPARHRSLHAAFEHSWQLLTEREQLSMMNLAVFAGGFTLIGAERVAGADRRRLTSLIEKSLIRRTAGRRYAMHQQLRQFAWGKLDAGKRETVQASQAGYLAGLIQAWRPAMNTPDQGEAFRAMSAELENIRSAWSFILVQKQTDYLEKMVDGLAYFYLRRGLQHEGVTAFGEAVAVLTDMGAPADRPDLAPLLARLLVWQGRCGELISRDYAVSEALFRRGLALAQARQLSLTTAQAQLGLGLLALYQGRRDEAETLLTKARATATAGAHHSALAGALNLLGWLAQARGDLTAGRSLCEEALRWHRACGDEDGLASTLTTLGIIHVEGGDFAAAQAAYAEALQLCQANNNRVGQSQALTGLFGVAARQKAYVAAQAFAVDSLAVSQDVGNRLGMAIAHHNLGYAAAGSGNHQLAVTHYDDALALYAALGGDPNRVANTGRYLVTSLLALGDKARAQQELCTLLAALTPDLQARLGSDLVRLGALLTGKPAPAGVDVAAELAALAAHLACDGA